MTTTRYFALVRDWDRPFIDPWSIFREVHAPDDFRFEVWDRSLRAWQLQMSLAKYTMNGEIGDIRISRAEARKVIKAQANIPPASAQASPDISFRPLRWRRRPRTAC